MNGNELRQKDISALRKELESLLREQFNLRIQKGSGQLAKPHQFKEVRRNIARIKTIINEKSRATL
jgi:large subunit ribosomal protein L29